jgi:predicted metalloprotease with PDZ domain
MLNERFASRPTWTSAAESTDDRPRVLAPTAATKERTMRKYAVVLTVVLALVAMSSQPLFAGGDKHKKCSADPADCKAKLQAKLAKKAWLGIEMDVNDADQYVITKVVPDSPAEKAGFQTGDILLAMNDHKYSACDKKSVKAAWSEVKPGSKATYVVLRNGGKMKLKAQLDHVPEVMQAKWIDEHMKNAHAVKVAAKTD